MRTILTLDTGAQTQLEKDALLPLEQRYVRRAEEVTFKGVTFRQVICMFPSQSRHLIRRARFLQIDTAFKRVKGWKEFEIMAWDNDTHTCELLVSVVCIRTLIPSIQHMSLAVLSSRPSQQKPTISYSGLYLRSPKLMPAQPLALGTFTVMESTRPTSRPAFKILKTYWGPRIPKNRDV